MIYLNKGFLLGLFVKNTKFLFLLLQKSSFHSYLFQRNACNFAVLCKPQLAVHKVFWKTVPNVLQTHIVANFQQAEKMPFLKESLGIKSLQFYWETLIEIILPTVNKTFFIIIISCWFMFSYRNRAGYLWQSSNLVYFSLSLKSSSATTYCSAKWLVLQIITVISEQFKTHPLITFVYLDFLFSLLNLITFFFSTCASMIEHAYIGIYRMHYRAIYMTRFYSNMNCKGWGILFTLDVIFSYKIVTDQKVPSDTIYQHLRNKTTDWKHPRQHWHTEVTVKLLLVPRAEVLFLPSSPYLWICFMISKVRKKVKDTKEDITYICISNACDCITMPILHSFSFLCHWRKNPHLFVSNLLQQITPQPTPISTFYCSIRFFISIMPKNRS